MIMEVMPEADAAYMSSPQAARILGITGVGVAQLIRQGKIPAVKIANRWLIPRAFVEEFALTYEGKRGRPRKKGRSGRTPARGSRSADTAVEARAAAAAAPPAEAAPFAAAAAEDMMAQPLPAETAPFAAAAAEDMAAQPPPAEAAPFAAAAAEDMAVQPLPAEAAPFAAAAAEDMAAQPPPAEADAARVTAVPATAGAAEAEEEEREGSTAFKVTAEVYHVDRNYTFEVYERGRITQRARIIVARLKPRIPSLPQFSFRWDYRYEHLNVDIHGVEPAALEWWTMGRNGYTGHLPRRLPGPARTFEAVIWLPVTFVFRGRLTLIGGSPAAVEEPPETPASGGLKRLWSRWPGKAR